MQVELLVRLTTLLKITQVSGYPSDTQAGNVSKDTTIREIVEVGEIDKEDFKLQNINLMFGVVNNVEYCSTMFNFPTLADLKDKIKNKIS